MRRQQDQQSKLFYELSSLVLNLLRSPPTPIDFSDDAVVSPGGGDASASSVRTRDGGMQLMSPAGFASLLLGISLALMLCGSVTFFIGFMLMPWVIGLLMILSVVSLISSLSMLGRSILTAIRPLLPPEKSVLPGNSCKDLGVLQFVIK